MRFVVTGGPGGAIPKSAGYDPVIGAWSGSGPPHLLPTALPTTDGTADIQWPSAEAALAGAAIAGSNAPQSVYAGPSHVGGLAGTEEGAEIDALIAQGRGDETQSVLGKTGKGRKSGKGGGVYTLAAPGGGSFTFQSDEELEVGAVYEISLKKVSGAKKGEDNETIQAVAATEGRTPVKAPDPTDPRSPSGPESTSKSR